MSIDADFICTVKAWKGSGAEVKGSLKGGLSKAQTVRVEGEKWGGVKCKHLVSEAEIRPVGKLGLMT